MRYLIYGFPNPCNGTNDLFESLTECRTLLAMAFSLENDSVTQDILKYSCHNGAHNSNTARIKTLLMTQTIERSS